MNIECCESVKSAVSTALASIFCPTQTDDAKNTTDAMYGTRKTRFGSAPDPEQRTFMDGLIDRYKAQGSPIQMIGMWGAIKAYGLCNDRNGIDVYDAMAIHRLNCVANDVMRFYPLGLEVTIISEDVTEQVLGSSGEQLQHRVAAYEGNLKRYAATHSDAVRIVSESELLHRIGKTTDDFLTLGETLTRHLSAYWTASSQIPTTEWESLSEYKTLQSVGWNGVITPEMREHYLNRCGSEYPTMGSDGRARMVCRYFGNALARYRMGMIGSGVEDSQGKIPPIKGGFGTLGPGVSKAMLKGRVDYKIKTSKNSKNSTPPWCGWGMLARANDSLEPTVIDVRNGSPDAYEKVTVFSNGTSYRADIYAA